MEALDLKVIETTYPKAVVRLISFNIVNLALGPGTVTLRRSKM